MARLSSETESTGSQRAQKARLRAIEIVECGAARTADGVDGLIVETHAKSQHGERTMEAGACVPRPLKGELPRVVYYLDHSTSQLVTIAIDPGRSGGGLVTRKRCPSGVTSH